MGLRENWKQFTLLLIVNAFVGGMVGLERSILPQLAQEDFHLHAHTAILSFILVFGISKAISNYFAGRLANRIGRKNLLVWGWIVAIPIPFLFIYAENWNWIIFANCLLGINQGLAWSSTVVMKIDLVGEKQRGLAMGMNESAGYLAVAAMAYLSSTIAENYGLRPYPFYLSIVLLVLGLILSIFWIKDTRKHVAQEGQDSLVPRLKQVFKDTSWRNPNLGAVTQAGLVNNLNDGMVWGLFPVLLAQKHFSLPEIGVIVSIYPAVWGLGQLFTGPLADRFSKKKLLFGGMLLQGLVLFCFMWAVSKWEFISLAALLGVGTALVYPTFLSSVAENTHPQDRAASIGIFRLWRDLGYAFGAVITGLVADSFGLNAAIAVIAGLTVLSAGVIGVRMREMP